MTSPQQQPHEPAPEEDPAPVAPTAGETPGGTPAAGNQEPSEGTQRRLGPFPPKLSGHRPPPVPPQPRPGPVPPGVGPQPPAPPPGAIPRQGPASAPPAGYHPGTNSGQFPIVQPGYRPGPQTGQFPTVPPRPTGPQTGQFPTVAPRPTGPQTGQFPTVPARPMGPPSGQFPIVQPHPAGRPSPPNDPAKLARRQQRIKRVLLVFAVLAAVVVLVGGIGGYLYYDKATAPDRSAPDVVVDNYLREYLVHRDDAKAALFTCKNPDLRAIEEFRSAIVAQEQKFGISISFDWGSMSVGDAKESRKAVSLTLSELAPEVDGSVSRSVTHWTFDAVQESGWRVCGATQLVSFQPQ